MGQVQYSWTSYSVQAVSSLSWSVGWDELLVSIVVTIPWMSALDAQV